MKLYKIKADHLYGDDKETRREQQLIALKSVGLSDKEIDGEVIGTAEQVLQLILQGYCSQYSVKDYVKIAYESVEDSENKIASCLLKTNSLVEHLFNEKCNQEQPNNLLMSVEETLLLEDACTDLLQENLSSGWRIIAVCPQPQRRPDYVLGRKQLPKTARRS